MTRVRECGDCNDNNPKIHPYQFESIGDKVNNNCVDGADETEYLYKPSGINNSATGFTIRAKINDSRTILAHSGGKSIYASVKYKAVGDKKFSEKKVTPRFRLRKKGSETIKRGHKKRSLGSFLQAEVNLTGLKPNKVYWATIQFFVQETDEKLSEHNSNRPYWTATRGGSPTDQLRTKMVLWGLNEYYYQLRELVGSYGSLWPNGTRYGAEKNEWWCSEYYAKVSKQVWPRGLAGIQFLHEIKEKFKSKNAYFEIGNSRQAKAHTKKMKMGDFLSTCGDGHTAMFLGVRSDGKRVRTLE